MTKTETIKSTVNKYSVKCSELNKFKDLIPEDHLNRITAKVVEFNRDSESAIDENRLMKIGIIGQIKRGKSSFLNSFLFNGDNVLPEAAIPMTAALTRIRYSKVPEASVEFFSIDEWESIENLAKEKVEREEKNKRVREEQGKNKSTSEQIQEPTEEQKSSFELVEMAKKSGIDIKSLLGTIKSIKADDRKTLALKLSDHVGSSGKYTSIVKSSELALDIDALQDVEIIDTPGMNDPITSRARKTEDFMGQCDVIFLLSHCSQFLDRTDMELLSQNIPSKGVRNIVLIGSIFDKVLIEEGNKYEGDFESAVYDLIERKEKEAKNNFDKVKSGIRKESVRDALEKSFPPVFISSRCFDIAKKHCKNLSEAEDLTLKNLQGMFREFNFNPNTLESIANMDEVRERYDDIKKDKEQILSERFSNILSGFLEAFESDLFNIKKDLENREKNLEEYDIESIEKKLNAILGKIDKGKNKISGVFSTHAINAEKDFADLRYEIEKAAQTSKRVNEQQVTETKSYSVSTSKWYKPWSWGSSETRYYTVTYKYANVHEAIDQIEDYVMNSKDALRNAVKSIINLKQFKIDISESIKNLFDFSDDNFDPDDILIPIQNAVERITIPGFELDVEKHIESIRNNFKTSQVRDSEIQNLRNEQARVVGLILKDILKETNATLNSIVSHLTKIQNDFIPDLTKDLKNTASELSEQMKDKRKYLEKYRLAIKTIGSMIKKPDK